MAQAECEAQRSEMDPIRDGQTEDDYKVDSMLEAVGGAFWSCGRQESP